MSYSGSIMPNQGDPPKPGKPGPEDDRDLFLEMSSFRKETLKVSDKDQKKWKEEAKRAATGHPPPQEKPPEKTEETRKEESRWDRIQREQRKKQIAFGLLGVCGLLLVIQLDLGGALRGLFTRPGPSATPKVAPPLPTTPVDQQQLAAAFLVCRWELRWFNARVELKPVAEEPYRYDWSTLEGPGSTFSLSRLTDPLERYLQISTGTMPPRLALLSQLASFVRSAARPAERLLADAITRDPGEIRTRGAALLDHSESFSQTAVAQGASRASLAVGLAELEAGGDATRARALIERAVSEAPPDDPWPARALALLDVQRGQPAEVLKLLETRHTAKPADEFVGYLLAWVLIQARKPADADRVLAKFEELPRGEPARLLRVVAAAGRRDWARFDQLAGKIDPDLAARSEPFRARYQALKGQALIQRGPNQTQIARDLFAKTLVLDPGCTWADLALARLLVKEKKLPEAASNYRRYLRRFPAFLPARRELVAVLAEGRYFSQALSEYAVLLLAEGPKDEYLKGVTFVASAMGRPDLARYLLDRARSIPPR